MNRHVIHFKNPANPNYIVDYDDIDLGVSGYQLRAYFHYEVSTGLVPATDQRNPAWVTTFDPPAGTSF